MFFVIGCSNNNEVFLLDKNYRGHLVVFYSQEFDRCEINEDLSISVPSDGVVFLKKGYLDSDGAIIRQNGKREIVNGNGGYFFNPKRIDYLVFYIGDSLDRKKFKYIDYKELKKIYNRYSNR